MFEKGGIIESLWHLYSVISRIEKVLRDIQGENSRKDKAISEKQVSTTGI